MAQRSYKVLPGTSLVIGFQFKGRISLVRNGNVQQLSTSGITGLHDTYRTYRNLSDTSTILVYFKEGGAAAFFKQPLHELFSESVSLDNFMLRSELLVLEDQLGEAVDNASRIQVIEKFFMSRIRDVQPDKLVMTAVAIIQQRKGDVQIRELVEQLNISQSPLEKRFRRVIGTSPKKFASIVKFNHVLRIASADKSLTSLACEAGFYDQSHFIKHFKSSTGETPEDFFSKGQ